MYKPPFIPSDPAAMYYWYVNFFAKLGQYATVLVIPTTVLASVQADLTMLSYAVGQDEIATTEAKKRSKYLKNLIYGDINEPLGNYPLYSAQPVAPAIVQAGMLRRLKKLINRIKNADYYNVTIGIDLGIEGSAATSALLKATDIKPVFVLELVNGHPCIRWRKGRIDGINIYVDRNDGAGFVMLYGCNRSKFVDMSPLPKTVTNWTYKISYRKGTEQFGPYSDPSTIAVIDSLATVNLETK